MELKTRCPECQTIFPVALEQLRLRKGYIRCIQCANIFDGFEAVVPADKAGAASEPRVPLLTPEPLTPEPLAADRFTPERPTPERAATPEPTAADRLAPGRPAPDRLITPPAPGPFVPPSDAGRTGATPAPRHSISATAPAIPIDTDSDSPVTSRTFTVGPDKREARSREPAAAHTISAARAAASGDAVLLDEPRLPSVVRPRGGPNFTISGVSMGAGATSPRSAPAAAVLAEAPDAPVAAVANAPIRNRRPFSDRVDEDDRAHDDDAHASPLIVEPRRSKRTDRQQPDFMRVQPRGSSLTTVIWTILFMLGLLMLLFQAVYVYRSQLASAMPSLRPMLVDACDRIGCTVPYDREINSIAITGSALRASGAPENDVSTLTLEVTVRNAHDRPQEWPTLVLDLKDASGAVVVRRNLAPSAWVPAELRDGPFPAERGITVQVPVSVRGLQANGYQIDKFFP